jgi:Tol biopolymer transport system component
MYRPTPTDEILKRGLRARAAGSEGDLLSVILQAVEATPQRHGWGWGVGRPSRTFVLLTTLALLAALAGGIAVASFLLRTDPAPVDAHANGEIVVQGDGCMLMAIDPVTGHERTLSSGVPNCYPKISAYSMAWAPDGSRLALGYSFFCGGCASPEATKALASNVAGLWVLDPVTLEFRQLWQCRIEARCFNTMGVTWSPDESRIAMVDDHDIWTVPAAGGDGTRVSNGSSLNENPAWAPDGSRLAYIEDVQRVVIVNPDGTGRAAVLQTPGETINGIAWSPGGDSLLVLSSGIQSFLRSVRLDGYDSTKLLTLSGARSPRYPQLSPDGERLAYIRATEMTSPDGPILDAVELWTVSPDGSDERLLFQAPFQAAAMAQPTWSPDGRYLALSLRRRAAPQPWETYIASADGSGVRHLGDTLQGGPAWRPAPCGTYC